MSWFNDANCQAASLLEHAQICYAVDLDFVSGHVRLHTALGDITINGNVYTGVGTLGNISGVPSRAKLQSESWAYLLSGVDLAVVPESELDNSFGRSVTEYEVWIAPESQATIGFEINNEGRISNARRRHGGPQPVIEVACENRLVILDQADGWRWTDEHQQQFFSGDLGCDQTKNVESKEVLWGGSRVDPGAPSYYRGHVPMRPRGSG